MSGYHEWKTFASFQANCHKHPSHSNQHIRHKPNCIYSESRREEWVCKVVSSTQGEQFQAQMSKGKAIYDVNEEWSWTRKQQLSNIRNGLGYGSTLLYPVSLLIGGWDWWSIQRANGQYRDHLVGQLTMGMGSLWGYRLMQTKQKITGHDIEWTWTANGI